MNIRKAYRMQEQYYRGFFFVPMRSVKMHNYFIYKEYKGTHKIYPLFESVLHKEVLDNYYIISIRKAIINSSVPLSQTAITDIEHTREVVASYFQECPEELNKHPYIESTISILLRALGNFKVVQHKIKDELTKLLSGNDFTGTYNINTEDIDKILDVMYQMYKGIQKNLKHLSNFKIPLPLNDKILEVASTTQYAVYNAMEALQRWCRVQETLIQELQNWRKVRAEHERQEVLN